MAMLTHPLLLLFEAESDGTSKPKCFLCDEVLANASMKPKYPKEHLKCVHPQNTLASAYLLREKTRFQKSRTLPKLGFALTQKPCLEASHKAAYHVSKQKKQHTIGETLLKQRSLEMVELVCGLKQRKKSEAVPV
jgi:hypothetical protein